MTFLALLVACGADQTTQPIVVTPAPDATVAEPDASPAAPSWSDGQKCENMCMSYCLHKNMCDGSSIETCRMAIDDADGGTCTERARLFKDIPQRQVEACIDAIEAMSCPDFIRMYNTGAGVPQACVGILS